MESDSNFNNGRNDAGDQSVKDAASPKRLLKGDDSNVQLRALIRSRDAGAIIGKEGAEISRLRKQYTVNIQIPSSPADERVLSIEGQIGSVCSCLREVLTRCAEPTGNTDHDLNLMVFSNLIGAIIGKGGSRVESLRQATGASIKVHSECLPGSSDRVVNIHGSLEMVMSCVDKILHIYNENQYGVGLSRSYIPPTPKRQRISSNGNEPTVVRQSGSLLNDTSLDKPGILGAFGQMNRPSLLNEDFGMGFGFGLDDYADCFGNIQKCEVTISNQFVGFIIGRGGDRIRDIRIQSKASIVIDNSEPDKEERTITITGTKQQIDFAQWLMRKAVHLASHP